MDKSGQKLDTSFMHVQLFVGGLAQCGHWTQVVGNTIPQLKKPPTTLKPYTLLDVRVYFNPTASRECSRTFLSSHVRTFFKWQLPFATSVCFVFFCFFSFYSTEVSGRVFNFFYLRTIDSQLIVHYFVNVKI